MSAKEKQDFSLYFLIAFGLAWLCQVGGCMALLQQKNAVLYQLALIATMFCPLLAVLLVLAGLIQGMFVSGGAILAIYALQRLQDKDQFRATLSCIWMVLNFVYAALQLSQGHYTPDCLVMVAIAIPLLLVATWLGNKLQKRISQATFIKVTYVLLTVIGIILLVK